MQTIFSVILLALFSTSTLASLLKEVRSGEAVISLKYGEDVCLRRQSFTSEDTHLFMVCDGHAVVKTKESPRAGHDAALHVIETLPPLLAAAKQNQPIAAVIEKALEETEKSMNEFQLAGATLSLALINTATPKLHVANLGDSRIVLSNKGDAEQPIADHGVDNQSEIERLRKEGFEKLIVRSCLVHDTSNPSHDPDWQCPYVDGCQLMKALPLPLVHESQLGTAYLRFTGSLGDAKLKAEKPGAIRSQAEIREIALSADHDILILASDGVFETMVDDPITNQEAIDLVAKVLQRTKDQNDSEAQAAQALAEHAAERVGIDDISVVVIRLVWTDESDLDINRDS